MRHIFEAMKRIEATTIIEVNSDELALIIEALCTHGENSHDGTECMALLDRIMPLREREGMSAMPVFEPHTRTWMLPAQAEFVQRHEDEHARYGTPLISVEQVNAIMESKSKLIDQ